MEVQEFDSLEEALESLNQTVEEKSDKKSEEQTVDKFNPIDPFNKFVDQHSLRFSGAPWFDIAKNLSVAVVGVGGIGSNLCYSLARTGIYKIEMYDGDSVDATNLAGQLYSSIDIGTHKVTAIRSFLNDYTPRTVVRAYNYYFRPDCALYPVTFTGLDSMEARKMVYRAWKHQYGGNNAVAGLFVDGRLSFDTIQIFAFTNKDTGLMDIYEKQYLFDDKNADATICSMKQTTYLASMIGAMMTNIFINWCINKTKPFIEASVPFKTQFDSNLFMFV